MLCTFYWKCMQFLLNEFNHYQFEICIFLVRSCFFDLIESAVSDYFRVVYIFLFTKKHDFKIVINIISPIACAFLLE